MVYSPFEITQEIGLMLYMKTKEDQTDSGRDRRTGDGLWQSIAAASRIR